MDKKVTGFIFNRTPYKDNDFLLHILTDQEKEVFILAKGSAKVSSKNAISTQFFMINEFIYTEKSEDGPKILKNVYTIKPYYAPYSDLFASGMFFFIYEVIQKIVNQMPLYHLTITCFDALENKNDPYSVGNYFLKHVCQGLGYQPSLDGCVFCHRKDHLVSFDFESGGFICSNCFKPMIHRSFSQNQLKEIYTFLKEDEMMMMSESTASFVFDLYVQFLKEQAGIKTLSHEFLKQAQVFKR